MKWVFLAIAFLCWYFDFNGVAVWALLIFVPMIEIKDGLSRFYEEIIDDYPRNKCVVPKVCKKYFYLSTNIQEKICQRISIF